MKRFIGCLVAVSVLVPGVSWGQDTQDTKQWWTYLVDSQTCAVADKSPGYMYNFDDTAGLGPMILRTNGPDGKLSQVELEYPDPQNTALTMISLYFTTDAYCEAYKQQQLHQNDDLQ